MRIRMLKPVKTGGRFYESGKSYDVAPNVAAQWAVLGYCELDKMIDAAPETKAAIVEPKPKIRTLLATTHKRKWKGEELR